MLLTITYEGTNTQELGFLLYKHPERVQEFSLSYGKAYVFYPEVSDARTTAALLLDIDPLDLARGKVGSREGGLFDYVNDRPYAATSFLGTALVRVFGTAMGGRCDKCPELAQRPLDLTARLYSLKDHGDEKLARELFEPLGYTVETERGMLDEKFPEWGDSPYINLTLRGKVRLSELLNHLYVLIPVFDRQRHFYITEDEIQKLLRHGEGWLANHPYKEKITHRYFSTRKSYARKALENLLPEEMVGEETESDEESRQCGLLPDGILRFAQNDRSPAFGKNTESVGSVSTEEEREAHTPLNTQRMEAVVAAVLRSGAASVLDLGCGEGRLTALLLAEPQIQKILACDVSVAVLEKAARRLRLDQMPAMKKNKLTLRQASLTYRDKRFEGYDCACVIEVIEHIEPLRLPAFARSLFGFARPRTVILTTPNREYNAKYEHLPANALRHEDHRFEWTRAEFAAWTRDICQMYGYACEISGIGEEDPEHGAPTQMAVFSMIEG